MPSKKRRLAEMEKLKERGTAKWLYDVDQEVGGLRVLSQFELGLLNEANIYKVLFLGCDHVGTYTQQSLRAKARKTGDNPPPALCNKCTARKRMAAMRSRINGARAAAATMTEAEREAIVQPFDGRFAHWKPTLSGLSWDVSNSR